MNGSEKQVAWARVILAEAVHGLRLAAENAPDFEPALTAISQYLRCGIDAAWFIENRHRLVPAVSVVYGTDIPSIAALEVARHALMMDGQPLQFGDVATSVTVPDIRAMFKAAWDKQLASR